MESTLTRILYPLPEYRRSKLALFLWWEARRPIYNLVVGATGLITLGAVWIFSIMPPGDVHLAGLWLPMLVYAMLANLCYTLGWGVDVLMNRLWGARAPDAGPLLFRQGLLFAVGVTLLPIVVAGLSWLVRVVMWLT